MVYGDYKQRGGSFCFFMLFNQNKVKNTLKSIKNVLKNIKYFIISLWKTCGKPMLICGKPIIYGVLLSLCDYNVGRLMSLYLINPSESCYLSKHTLRNANCQPPKVTKPPQIPHKTPPGPHKYPQGA